MKLKTYIYAFFILLSGMIFGQSSGSGSVNFKVSFDKKISIKDLEVFYFEKNCHTYIDYEIDEFSNSLILKGSIEWWGRPTFPTIVFSYPQKDRFFMFYLFSNGQPYEEHNFKEKIFFSFDSPNALIKLFYPDKNSMAYKIEYGGKNFLLGLIKEERTAGIGNELLRINQLKKN